MPKFTVLRGLPGSGKSTWAFGELKRAGNTVRVNRDELRKMLHGPDSKWSGDKEKITVAVEKVIVAESLKNGNSVIVDDTNLLGTGTRKWTDWAHILVKAESAQHPIAIEIKDFTNDPIQVSIDRDRLRTGSARVGRGVIERMALRAGLVNLDAQKDVVIVDIDGTLANIDHRVRFVQQIPKDWKRFFATVSDDEPFLSIISIVNTLFYRGYYVIVLSGRGTDIGYETDSWLRRYGVRFHNLFMRQGGDYRPDFEVKRELADMMFAAGLHKEAIKLVIDDRDSVCAVWRELLLPLVQVDHGNAIQIEPSAFKLAVDVGFGVDFGVEGCVEEEDAHGCDSE